jgi:hypothetical protein
MKAAEHVSALLVSVVFTHRRIFAHAHHSAPRNDRKAPRHLGAPLLLELWHPQASGSCGRPDVLVHMEEVAGIIPVLERR